MLLPNCGALNPTAPEFVPSQGYAGMPFSFSSLQMWDGFSDLRTECQAVEPAVPRLLGGKKGGNAKAGKPSAGISAQVTSPLVPGARRNAPAAESPAQVATLVLKNVALDTSKAQVSTYLQSLEIPPIEVELHLDANGTFRGTAFARYESPGKAREAFDVLGPHPEMDGRKVRVEIQKCNSLCGRKRWQTELPQEELGAVQAEIESFLHQSEQTINLSVSFNAHQRKYAHSLAERHNLVHSTRQGEDGETYVFLSKWRNDQAMSRKKAHSFSLSGPRQASDSFDGSSDAGCRARTVSESAVQVSKGIGSPEFSPLILPHMDQVLGLAPPGLPLPPLVAAALGLFFPMKLMPPPGLSQNSDRASTDLNESEENEETLSTDSSR